MISKMTWNKALSFNIFFQSVCWWSVSHVGPDNNISTTTWWITLRFYYRHYLSPEDERFTFSMYCLYIFDSVMRSIPHELCHHTKKILTLSTFILTQMPFQFLDKLLWSVTEPCMVLKHLQSSCYSFYRYILRTRWAWETAWTFKTPSARPVMSLVHL